jgi:hypothetical protein
VLALLGPFREEIGDRLDGKEGISGHASTSSGGFSGDGNDRKIHQPHRIAGSKESR